MKKLVHAGVIGLLAGLVGCPMDDMPSGGLDASDFVQIATNGFEPADQAQDQNDYAWSMAYFQADGADRGYLYVGTWNRVQQWKGFQSNIQPVYPEIRRYRPDWGVAQWETVCDTRDYGLSDTDRPHGFREMRAYRNKSDGRLFLYAGGRGDTTQLWRSETGEPGTWGCFWTWDREGSIRGMAVHNDLLYMAFYNDYGMFTWDGQPRAVILATDGQEVWTVMEDGFGNAFNVGIFTVASWNGWLYAGVHNSVQGGEVWKMAGPDPDAPPARIVSGGGPERMNEAALTLYPYGDYLYVGMESNHMLRLLDGLEASALLRVSKDDHWETISGPGSISGLPSGFGQRGNSYVWSMCEHEGWLYAGTYDIITGLTYMVTHPQYLMGMMGLGEKVWEAEGFARTLQDLILLQPVAGGDLYKSRDGVTWYPITQTGFGHPNNYGFRTMVSVNGRLYTGTANPYDGLEIYASVPAE